MIATILAIVWSTPVLRGAPLDHVLAAFVEYQRPVVVMRFGPDQWRGSVPEALFGGGYVRVAERGRWCNLPAVRYEPSQALLDIAKARHWIVAHPSRGATTIVIPVGSYRYIAGSASLGVDQPDYAYVDFRIQLVPNANAQTLAFLAARSAWDVQPALTAQVASTLGALDEPRLSSLEFVRGRGGWRAPNREAHAVQSVCPLP